MTAHAAEAGTAVDDEVTRRFAEVEAIAAAIDRRLRAEVERLGFAPGQVVLKAPGDALYRLERDPSDGSCSLVGEWRDEQGIKSGVLLFNGDGSFFVEQDVTLPHPRRPRWFVEAVNAWGRRGDTADADAGIKAEPRLLPMPD